jgi:hypothetical protein
MWEKNLACPQLGVARQLTGFYFANAMQHPEPAGISRQVVGDIK